MTFARGSGILLHPTSLPGPHGSGDIGAGARAFIDWLADAKQRYWQMLPLGPGGYGNSPYSALSAFAANPMLIDLDGLVERGWLPGDMLAASSGLPAERVDFEASGRFRWQVLRRAAEAFFARPSGADRDAFEQFRRESATWLPDYALFAALHASSGQEWTTWDQSIAQRTDEALDGARKAHATEIRLHEFTQWVFSGQWRALRDYAASKEVSLIGDIPIFVALHSADVWAHPELFQLDANGCPTVVAGVPPDYFSKTGQRWGNPLYRWDRLAERGYDWWIDRVRSVLGMVDAIRLDHFRGFAGYWEIPASEPTAVKGRWVPGPGAGLFEAIRAALGGTLPIIAEDLGVITPDVEALRDRFDLPGMRVLQFAFGTGPKNPFLPHNYKAHTVVYTGTHDNDTTVGWFAAADEGLKDHLRRYLRTDGAEIHWDLIRAASSSVADVAIVPMQDVLGLGSGARMNRPGESGGNWGWRFQWDQVQDGTARRLADLTDLFGRSAEPAA